MTREKERTRVRAGYGELEYQERLEAVSTSPSFLNASRGDEIDPFTRRFEFSKDRLTLLDMRSSRKVI